MVNLRSGERSTLGEAPQFRLMHNKSNIKKLLIIFTNSEIAYSINRAPSYPLIRLIHPMTKEWKLKNKGQHSREQTSQDKKCTSKTHWVQMLHMHLTLSWILRQPRIRITILFKMIRLANKLLIFLSMLLKPNRVI